MIDLKEVTRSIREVEREMGLEHLKRRMIGVASDTVAIEYRETDQDPWKLYFFRDSKDLR